MSKHRLWWCWMSKSMRNEVMWAIRDDHTLAYDEKSLLWAVESRGEARRTWKGMSKDSGLPKNRLYDVRRALKERGVLDVTERPGTTTLYRVLPDGLHHCGEACKGSEAAEMTTKGFHHCGEGGFTTVVKGASPRQVMEEDLKDHNQGDQLLDLPHVALLAHNFSRPSRLNPDPSTWTTEDEGVEMCESHLSSPKETCDYCSRFKVTSRLPLWKQEELHEKRNAEEGWDEYEDLGLSGSVPRYQGRNRG